MDRSYVWFVRGVDGEGPGPWSPGLAFRLDSEALREPLERLFHGQRPGPLAARQETTAAAGVEHPPTVLGDIGGQAPAPTIPATASEVLNTAAALRSENTELATGGASSGIAGVRGHVVWNRSERAAIGVLGTSSTQVNGGVPTLIGVAGVVDNPAGIAVPTEIGVYGYGGSRGVLGESESGTAIRGNGRTGVWGTTSSADGEGGIFVNSGGGEGLVAAGSSCCHGGVVTGYAARLQNNSENASGPDVLALSLDIPNPGAGANFIGFFADASSIDETPALVGEIQGDGSGGVHFTGSAASLVGAAADFAEYLPRRDPGEELSPAEVVGLRSGKVGRSLDGAERLAVVTTDPLVLGNRTATEHGTGVAVALLGQVPVRVTGPVSAGDVLVGSPADDGTATAVSPEEFRPDLLRRIVGHALESDSRPGPKVVPALVGVTEAGLVAHAFAVQDREMRQLRQRLDRLEAVVARLAPEGEGAAPRAPEAPAPLPERNPAGGTSNRGAP
ncbi:MAG: hypothetical protein R3325_08670 [Thermoanaerobaculia bacterium]|nr:hypothetical protein [Thermoanaerobaculia bacterium]